MLASSKIQVRRTSQGSVVKYNIPYSEHSSYKELQEFLRLVIFGLVQPPHAIIKTPYLSALLCSLFYRDQIDHVNVIPLVKTNPELLEGLLQSA